jgi:arylformamidase
VQSAGKAVELLVGEGYNHFEIMETFANPYGLLGRASLRLFGLEGG